MIKQTLKFKDYNGNQVTKDYWFHMNKADVAEFRYRKDGSDLTEVLARIMATENVRGILDMFKEIARSAVGRKSEDGLRFVKDDDARSDLFDTEAYSELMEKMITDADFAASFIAGILPEDMAKNVREANKEIDAKSMSKDEIAAKMRELQERQRQLEME